MPYKDLCAQGHCIQWKKSRDRAVEATFLRKHKDKEPPVISDSITFS